MMNREMFNRLLDEGMGMVSEAAAYLDGPGRQTSRSLPRNVALAYAGESMRLTTMLMQIAAWLLANKAVFEGEMPELELQMDKYRIGAQEIALGDPLEASEELPAELLDLMARARQLYERVQRLDHQLFVQEEATATDMTIADMTNVIQGTFGR